MDQFYIQQKNWLVVSTHLKNISQIGSFPQVGVEIKNIWNHHLENYQRPFKNLKNLFFWNLKIMAIHRHGWEFSLGKAKWCQVMFAAEIIGMHHIEETIEHPMIYITFQK